MSVLDEHDDELALTAVTAAGLVLDEEAPLPSHFQVVVICKGTFATHAVDTACFTIGRSARCDVTINDESISRKHAVLTIGEHVMIEDLGSVNGTTVRGVRLEANRPVMISVGELVGLGEASMILQQRSRAVRSRRLWTHDYFETRLEGECARQERSGAAFALLRIHTDRTADATYVEETLSEILRESDVLGSYGPHEYEVLLPDTPPAKADEAVRRIDARLVERGLKCRMFVACCPRDGQSAYQLAARVAASARKKSATGGPDIVVSDPHMQSLYRLVEQIAVSHISVLLLGETGVGKEVFASALHRASPRSAGPFVELNCAALTETLLESELFGHEKGAFTNASAAKPGIIETAHGGTLLLDEIGDMPLSTQVKLLRVIEESQLRRVGGVKPRPFDVRFVAATNNDLEAQVARGAFRSDLFFRLNGVTIVIPPLRERLADLEPLAQAFINRARAREGAPTTSLVPEALQILKGYSWPGNVRELKNVIERAVLLCGAGPIHPAHLPAEKMRAALITDRPIDTPRAFVPRDPVPDRPADRPRKGSEEEQQGILQALKRANGNQTTAARLLGISRRTLVNRLNDYEKVPRPRKDKLHKG